jgi:menaquinol-cytochrome c reductase iron-sulfur subunit
MQRPATTGEDQSRRTFLTYGIFAIGGLITAALGIPALGSLILPTLRSRKSDWVSAGAASQYAVGQPKLNEVTITIRDGWSEQQEKKPVWVVRKSDTDFQVYNGRCVHLGCAYSWKADQNVFECPCHGGRYSIDGVVMGGPPPRPLDSLSSRVESGNLLVEFVDYRVGVPAKEAE